MSTNGQSRTSSRAISTASTSAISSPASASGATPWSTLDGRDPDCGPGPQAYPASHSAKPESVPASTTSDTSGPSSTASFSSARLQSSLENRLRARTASLGSTLYSLTWKTRASPSQRRIPQLLATARHRKGSASTGLRRGWATPRTSSANCSEADARKASDGKSRLENEVHLIPVATQPDIGVMHTGLSVLTGSSARLDPDFARWLTGLPMEWSHCAVTATLSTPKPLSASSARLFSRLKKKVDRMKSERNSGDE